MNSCIDTFDKLHEECGVFGIYQTDGKDASHSLYYGLCALQHRGQESAGIAVCNTNGPKGNMNFHKGMGLVNEIFTPEVLSQLHGNLGVGHVRYSTTGDSNINNAQPLVLDYLKGTLALVYNGNLVNTDPLKKSLQLEGHVFHTNTDTEVIACKIAKERTHTSDIESAIAASASALRGGYALLVASPRKLIGMRDPLGLKPLCLGKRDNAYILASESCALSSVNAEFIRDIAPGEIITISPKGIHSDFTLCQDKQAHCIFEYIYFARLDSNLDGISVYDARIKAGNYLAYSHPIDADLVTGVPDSGLAAAMGYSQASGIPFALAFHKNSYVGRTFIKPTQEERETAVQIKLNVLKSVVAGKRIVLIDDSIVRGTTIASLIRLLKENGATEVHVRISSPPFLYPCYYGTDVPNSSQLIAATHSCDEICRQIGADSLAYLNVDDLSKMVNDLPVCRACFDNHYPV